MDTVLHAERLDRKTKRVHRHDIGTLPDGAMIARAGAAFAVRGDRLLRWTPSGYAQTASRPRAVTVEVLTPPSILAVLRRVTGHSGTPAPAESRRAKPGTMRWIKVRQALPG